MFEGLVLSMWRWGAGQRSRGAGGLVLMLGKRVKERSQKALNPPRNLFDV